MSTVCLVIQFMYWRTERPPCITYILGVQKILYPTPVGWETSLHSGHGQWHTSPPKVSSTPGTITLIKRYFLRYVSQVLGLPPRTRSRGSCSDKVGAISTSQGQSVMFSQQHPGGCIPIFSLDSFFLWLHPVACKPDGMGVPYHCLCPLGYLFQSTLVGITCFNAPVWCTMDGTHHIPPLVWVIHRFCR